MLYDRYSEVLYGIALKIVQSEEIASDVLQESFVKIWQNGPKYESKKGTLFTWMLNITRNTAIDKTRSSAFKSRKKIQDLDNSVYNNKQLSEELNPEHIGLREIVEKLDEKYRNVIDLLYFQGFTQQEVMEELDIPLGTVKSRARIAIRELRKHFNELKIALIIFWLFFIRL